MYEPARVEISSKIAASQHNQAEGSGASKQRTVLRLRAHRAEHISALQRHEAVR